jgi:hypothetical protein
VPIHHLVCTWILTIDRVHDAAGNLHQSWQKATESWAQGDAAHNKEANLPQINRATSLVAKAKWSTGDNDRSFKSERMFAPQRDGKVDGKRIDALMLRLRTLPSAARTRSSHLGAFSWGHLCATVQCGSCGVYRWTLATETHLTGARCHGATAASTNPAADLVCQ